MEEKWSNIISGSDIRGIVIENNNKKINLTDDMIKDIAFAFAVFLSKKLKKPITKLNISIGMDSRISSEKIKELFIEQLILIGVDVYDCGLCTTPSMFMSTLLDKYTIDGALEITASHLPFYYNGLKFFTNLGGIENNDVMEILELANNRTLPIISDPGKKHNLNLMDIYSESLVKRILSGINDNNEKPLSDFKIIVDAGNGVGGFYATHVLKKLGADITGSQFLEPDGMFPNHIPNPENEEAMNSIKKAVLNNKADLGIIFDTDVDRAAIVDSNGLEINKNSLIALISSIVLKEHPNSTIVTDSVTSNGLTKFIKDLGGIHRRFKRGYKNVINEALTLNNNNIPCYMAIETSGHCALKENYFQDDGAYLITKIIIKMANLKKESNLSISDLIKNLEIPKESVEYRLEIGTKDIKGYWDITKNLLEESFNNIDGWTIDENNFEGLRVNCDKNSGYGWFLIRLSLHEPLLVLNIESDLENGTDNILNSVYKILKNISDIDIKII